jgi:transposase-like protein
MLFPIDDLLDDDACYRLLLSVLHPGGLHCPKGHPLEEGQAPHDRHREPVLDYRCRTCGKVFNLYTGTPLHAVRFSPARLVMILRGFCQGVTTLHLSQELGVGRRNLLKLRQRVQGMALERFSPLATARSGRRGRRDVPERRGERAPPPRP